MNQPDSNKPDSNKPDSSETTSHPKKSRSVAEQTSFFIALIILLSIVGSVGYLWVSGRNQTPPVLQVSTDSAEQREASYYVPFTITNTGGTTAETVQVIAELRINNEIVEWGEQSIDFLSREEEVTGAFVFGRDPSEGELVVRVASYLTP